MLEVCVDNIASVNAAVEGGAQRIELCSALSEGGLTPSVGFLKIIKRTVILSFSRNFLHKNCFILIASKFDGICYASTTMWRFHIFSA